MKLHSLVRTALVLVFMPIYLMVSAQEFDSELLTHRIYAKINQVNEYIYAMNDKYKNLSFREYYKNKALCLFYNRGDNYIIPFGSEQKVIKIVCKYGRRNLYNSVNILSSYNVKFGLDTFIVSPKTFNLSDLEKSENNIYILPCKIARRSQNCQIDAEVYLLEEDTIDGIELITFITGLNAN